MLLSLWEFVFNGFGGGDNFGGSEPSNRLATEVFGVWDDDADDGGLTICLYGTLSLNNFL